MVSTFVWWSADTSLLPSLLHSQLVDTFVIFGFLAGERRFISFQNRILSRIFSAVIHTEIYDKAVLYLHAGL
jgi:hypothetical protein